jgi:hypothetical protein
MKTLLHLIKRFRTTALLVLLPFMLNSCFEVSEEYYFENDGSGTAYFTVDLSQSLGMLKLIQSMDTTGVSMKTDSLFENKEVLETLSKIDGIYNIKNLSDTNTGIISYSYSFKNIEALNRALATKGSNNTLGMGGGREGGTNIFVKKGKTITRVLEMAQPEDLPGNQIEQSEDEAMTETFLADANWKITYHFNSKVKKVSGANTIIEDDKKTVVSTVKFLDLTKGKKKINCTIKLK